MFTGTHHFLKLLIIHKGNPKVPLNLNPIHFANAGHESDGGEWNAEDRSMFNRIRVEWPELSCWGDLPIGVAWGAYCQDVHLLSWMDESQVTLSRTNLLGFVAYIQWHEINGQPQWSITHEELLAFANEQGITI